MKQTLQMAHTDACMNVRFTLPLYAGEDLPAGITDTEMVDGDKVIPLREIDLTVLFKEENVAKKVSILTATPSRKVRFICNAEIISLCPNMCGVIDDYIEGDIPAPDNLCGKPKFWYNTEPHHWYIIYQVLLRYNVCEKPIKRDPITKEPLPGPPEIDMKSATNDTEIKEVIRKHADLFGRFILEIESELSGYLGCQQVLLDFLTALWLSGKNMGKKEFFDYLCEDYDLEIKNVCIAQARMVKNMITSKKAMEAQLAAATPEQREILIKVAADKAAKEQAIVEEMLLESPKEGERRQIRAKKINDALPIGTEVLVASDQMTPEEAQEVLALKITEFEYDELEGIDIVQMYCDSIPFDTNETDAAVNEKIPIEGEYTQYTDPATRRKMAPPA